MIRPIIAFGGLNICLPWAMSFGLRLVAEYQVRQVLILLAVILIFTLNEYAARFWPKHRWWF